MPQEIKLLSTYDGFPPQSIITVSDSIAAQLLPMNATTDLSGGVRRYKDIPPVGNLPFPPAPGPGSVGANQRTTITLPGDYQLNLSGNSSAQGTFAVLDTSGAELSTGVLAPGAATIGPFNDARQVRLIGQAGLVSFSAEFEAFGANTTLAVKVAGIANGIMSYQPAGGTTTSISDPGATWACIVTCLGGFQGIRIGFENESTTTPLTIKAKVAASPTATNRGDALSYLTVTFDGADLGVVPVAQMMNGETVRGFIWSDFIPLRSVPRTDIIGADPAFYLRAWGDGQIRTRSMDLGAQRWTDTGDYYASNWLAGDQVTATTTQIIPANTGVRHIPFAQIDFYTGGKTASMTAFGDSMTGGIGAYPFPWPLALRKEFRAMGRPELFVANAATAGQNRDVTSRIFRERAAKTKPKVAFLWNYSVNGLSTPGVDTAAQQMAFLIGDLEFCRANGITPVVVSMHPDGADAASTRQFLAGWGIFLDLAQLLRTSAANTAIAPQYSTDSTHLTYLGATKFASYAAPTIADLV